MNSFFYLFRTKIKGSVRVQFSSLGTGMAVIFTVLIYGILIGTIFTSSVPYDKETMYLQAATAILAGIGVTAFFSMLSLMSKRKALLYDTDAFYFFSGPYTKTQTNLFILVQIKGFVCFSGSRYSGYHSDEFSCIGDYSYCMSGHDEWERNIEGNERNVGIKRRN